ncbi:BNR/Asp-box repeat-containing protein, partial [Pseudomonas coronafaciens]
MPVISRNLTAWSAALIVVAIFLSAWLSHPLHRISGFAVAPAPVGTESLAPKASYSSRFASSDLNDFVHSSAVTALPGGDLMSVWFAGSREGAGDVEIRTSRFDARTEEWGGEQVLATRESTQSGTGKYIRKLGNPVIALAPDNRLWLFYVSVSVGGWAGSSVNAMVSS